MHLLLQTAEQPGYLSLVKHTTEYDYLLKIEKLSSAWLSAYHTVTTLPTVETHSAR